MAHHSTATHVRIGRYRRTSLLTLIRKAIELKRQRRSLLRLSNRQLADIGISRDDAQREAARPIWDIPADWLKS